MNPSASALLTDLYEFTMAQAYLEQGMDEPAVFEFFVRKLPAHRNFLVAAGLEQVLDYLSELRISKEELAWLDQSAAVHRGCGGHAGGNDFLSPRADLQNCRPAP